MEQKVKEFITDYFLEKGKFAGVDRNEMTKVNFVEAKLLDSIEFITLISEIEENFDVIFTEEDLQSSMFSSIEGIVKIANSRFHSGLGRLEN